MAKSPDREWIADKLGVLTEHAADLVEVKPDVTNEYRPLTALKLIVLSAGVDVFSRIVPQRYDHNYYLDLFAGAGATRLRGMDSAVVGSPILAPVMSHHEFAEYHFVELKGEKADALKARLDYMDSVIEFPREKCFIHEANANDFVHEFLENHRSNFGGFEGFNMFSFVDPEGMDPDWHVTRRIADLYGDMLIHYPETTVNRDHETGKARSYFPTGVDLEQCRTEDKRRAAYRDGLESRRNTDITVPIRIDSGSSGGNYHYDLIYATRETGGGAPYVAAMEDIQRKISLLDGDHIRRVLETLEGDAEALDYFFDGESQDDSRGGQESLDNYGRS